MTLQQKNVRKDQTAWVIARLKEIDPKVLQKAGLSLSVVQNLSVKLHLMTLEERGTIFRHLEKLVEADLRRKAANDFLSFVRLVWPGFIEGAHIRQMAKAYQDIAEGRKRRLIINMPPRHSKSELTSYLFPAWFIGKFPNKKLMIATHTATLATSFGGKIRNLINTDIYQRIFPGVTLREDSKAKGLWLTNHDGEFFAAGVLSAIAGRGADLFIMDDPYSETDARNGEYNPDIWDKVWQWYMQGPRQRLQPGAAICLVHTRWSLQDMTAKLLRQQKEEQARTGKRPVNPWHLIQFPAILPSGRPLWPEFWSLEEIEAIREEIDAPYWQAQYMQDPTSDTVAIVKRSDWKVWEKTDLPEVSFIITAVDTAHSKKKTNDFSAFTCWGVFNHEVDGEEVPCAILLEARRERYEYPELKMMLLMHHRDMRPDLMRIEAKAAGMPLIQELRRMHLPIDEFTPTAATGDKVARLRQVQSVFKKGRVFKPRDRTWANEVVEEIATFPKGEHDDFVDTVSMTMAFLLQGEFIPVDEVAEEDDVEEAEVGSYY